MTRSYRIEYRRDFIAGFDWRLLLTGQSVGGYGYLADGYGGKFLLAEDAREAGRIWKRTGLLPCHQTDESISAIVNTPAKRKAA